MTDTLDRLTQTAADVLRGMTHEWRAITIDASVRAHDESGGRFWMTREQDAVVPALLGAQESADAGAGE